MTFAQISQLPFPYIYALLEHIDCWVSIPGLPIPVMRSNQVTEKAEATAAKYKDEMEELRKAVEELSTAAIGNLQTAKLAVEDERDEMRDELAKVMLSLVPGGNSLTGRGSGEG